MIPLTIQQIERLSRLARDTDFATLCGWLAANEAKFTRDALHSANPQMCGAAAMLQDLNQVLESLPEMYQRLQKTGPGSAFS